MLGFVRGQVLAKYGATLTVGLPMGVGYDIDVASSTANALGVNEDVSLFIDVVVGSGTNNAGDTYFGFETHEDRHVFRVLRSFLGMGPRSAFGVLSHFGIAGLLQVAESQAWDQLKSAPGVGVVAADRIANILRHEKMLRALRAGTEKDGNIPAGGNWAPVMSALENLGYKKQNVSRVCSEMAADGFRPASENDATLSAAIQEGLKRLGHLAASNISP